MNRLLAVLVAVLVAGGVAFLVFRGDAPTPDAAAAPIEALLAEGRVDDARRALAQVRARLDPATADYLDGLALVIERKDVDALPLLERARRARPRDWRIVSTLAAATGNAGRCADALALVEEYAAAVPDDERAWATIARYRLDEQFGPPDPAKALAALDRVDRLPRREGDRTAIPVSDLRLLRIRALLATGKSFESRALALDATRETPQDPEAWFLLGETARRGTPIRGEEALDSYGRAAALAPGGRRYAEQYVMAVLQMVQSDYSPEHLDQALRIVDAWLAASPDDPKLLLLKARLFARRDATTNLANDIYAELLKRDLPKSLLQEARRNRAALLYDWSAGGRAGDYLEDAYVLMKRYVDEGGAVDGSLADVWEQLQKQHAKKVGGGK
jgi:Flp pilus assembly protein TadD